MWTFLPLKMERYTPYRVIVTFKANTHRHGIIFTTCLEDCSPPYHGFLCITNMGNFYGHPHFKMARDTTFRNIASSQAYTIHNLLIFNLLGVG